MNKLFVTVFLSLLTISFCICDNDLTPISSKLALTQNVDEMRVTWFTQGKGSSPVVLYSTQPFTNESISYSQSQDAIIEDLSSINWEGYSNIVLLQGLEPSTTYYYLVGDKDQRLFSELYNFTTGTTDFSREITPFSFVVYGDMGIWGGSQPTLNRINERINDISFLIHVGDIAYADLGKPNQIFGNQTVWNTFLDMIHPISSHIPYMVCPGNHDIFELTTSILRHSFYMPAPSIEDSWYSFDYNGVHFVSYSTEHLILPLSPQHNWLKNDLETYRKINPDGWVVAFAHRPFYCSTTWSYCNSDDYRVMLQDSLEYLLYDFNVDLFIGGHAHSYERTLPMYGSKINYGTYANPKATVHMVVGTGGCQEGPDPGWDQPAPIWSIGERLLDVGYGVISFSNNTHLQYQFINATTNLVRDEFWLTKGNWN